MYLTEPTAPVSQTSFILVTLSVLAVFFVGTRQRNEVWQSPMSIWADTVEKSPQKPRPLINLGNEYVKLGDLEKAIDLYSRAVQYADEPRELGLRDRAQLNLAVLHMGSGQYQVAFDIVNRIIKEHPSLEALNIMAVLLVLGGQPQAAIEVTDDLKARNNDFNVDPALHMTRGHAFTALGKCAEANMEFLYVQTLKPGTAVPFCALQPPEMN